MNCVCGCPVSDHAKVYDGVLYQEGWFTKDGEGRFLGLSARPFTLSGRCLKCNDGDCPAFHAPAFWKTDLSRRERFDRALDLARPSDGEWWLQFDRPQGAGKPEVQ